MISSFENEYFFLNNYYPCNLVLDEGTVAKTVAHGYNSLIAENYSDRVKILNSKSPSIATNLGNHLLRLGKVRKDYNSMHMTIMQSLLKRKFEDAELKEKLLATGDELLLNNNTYNDAYWGTCIRDNNYYGYNHLGKLLMIVRDNLLELKN